MLNNSGQLNLINEGVSEEIYSAFVELEKNNNVNVILIKSACGVSKKGKEIFSAGVNLKEYDKKFDLFDRNPSAFEAFLRGQRKLATRIENSNKITIIGINGMVIGGFFEIALACDMILASEKASFMLNEVNIGLIPGYGGIYRLLRTVGKNRAFEIIASGREIHAGEALNLGIVSEIFEHDRFEEKILEYCDNLSRKSPNSLYLIKNTINKLLKNAAAEDIEVKNFLKAIGSEDSREGIAAFLEKRKPEFK